MGSHIGYKELNVLQNKASKMIAKKKYTEVKNFALLKIKIFNAD